MAGSLAAAGFCALGIGWTWNSLKTPGPTPEQIKIETQAQALHLSQEQKQAQIDAANAKLDSEWHVDRASTWLRLLEIGALATLTVCVPAGAVAGGLHLWHNRDMPDKATGAVAYRGLTPELRIAVNSAAVQTRNLLAVNPALPHGLVNLHTVNSPRITGPTALTEEPALTISRIPDVPPFGRLIAAGEVGGNRPLLLGYGESGDVRHEGAEEFSIGIAGMPNFGKSNTAAGIIAQHVLRGADHVLCDPQAGSKRSLATRLAPLEEAGLFLLPTAVDDKAILSAVRTVHGELKVRQKRQMQWRKDHGPGEPAPKERLLVLAMDEWTTTLRGELATELPRMLADILQAGPQRSVIALLLAQQWATASVGGGMVRDVLSAGIIHRCRTIDARMVSGMRSASLPEGINTLEQGEAVVFAPGVGPVRLNIPRLEADDLVEVARMAAAQRSNGASGNRLENPFFGAITPPKTLFLDAPTRDVGNGESDLVSGVSRAQARARVGDALADQIIAMWRSGKKIPAIAKALYPPAVGQERLTGPRYYAATDEVTEVVHEWSMAREQPTLAILPMESPKTEEEA
jgi:hypothetical protein